MNALSPSFDLDGLEAFVRVAELRSFTRAAEMLGLNQSTVSLKVRRLEEGVGRRLLDRTPRLVKVADGCEAILEAAQDLLQRRDAVLATLGRGEPRRLSLGLSDQAVGRDLPVLLGELVRSHPDLTLGVHVGASRDLLDRGGFDAVVVRGEDDRRLGEILFEEPYRWIGAPGWRWTPGSALPLATLAEPCGVRAMAIRALDDAGLPWRDAFVGGGASRPSAQPCRRGWRSRRSRSGWRRRVSRTSEKRTACRRCPARASCSTRG